MSNMDTNTTINTVTKENFMINLIDTLNNENIKRINNNRELVDVCYVTSIIDLQINKCQEFLNDINNHEYDINYYFEEELDFSNYKNGKIKVDIKKSDEDRLNGNIYDIYHSYFYHINFLYDSTRNYGYMTSDGQYEFEDWDAPAFSIDKVTNLGEWRWEGEKDNYLEYQKQFELNSKNKNEELEILKTEREKQELRDEIKMLQDKLMLLEGGI